MTSQKDLNKDMVALLSSVTDSIQELRKAVVNINNEISDTFRVDIFPNLKNMDALIFFDAANIWGVDYDSSISGSNKIRSSIGIGLDWYTVIGPLTFSLSEVITKEDTDITESFRFNLGTTF